MDILELDLKMFNPLLTPRDWQMRAQLEATRLVGTHEYEAKMVEMRRYKLMADEIDRLTAYEMQSQD